MSTSNPKYTLGSIAYTLPLLHAAKYTSSTVIGLLVGRKGSSIEIIKAIPLIHHHTALSPITEAGISLVQQYASQEGLEVVGVYVGHEGDQVSLGRVGERILEGLRESFSDAVGLVVSDQIYLCLSKSITCWTSPSPNGRQA